MICLALALIAAAKIAGALAFEERAPSSRKAVGAKPGAYAAAGRASEANSMRIALPDVLIDRGRSWAQGPPAE